MSSHNAHDNAQQGEHRFSNRLIHETSPYLLQYAHNPVDWYPWGEEALAKARTEDKPILLSVGYSACHWCHVQNEESFENEATAAVMNELFVSIKVDREERPDIDALYMDAVQALTGSGGWPMTVFLLPDGTPYFGGTYFPPVARYGMPAFPDLLRRMADLYHNQRDEVDRQAAAFRDFYQQQSAVALVLPPDLSPSQVGINPDVLTAAADQHLALFDTTEGGLGRAPKFPHPLNLEFLLRIAARGEGLGGGMDEKLLPLVRLTLDKMAAGGMYDQIGGGFHRYSTDAHWLVPHFEKMLYDNALLAPVYLHAWQLTAEARYRRVCEEILDYVLREMTDAAGGFYSTQDADSEGVEGKFYVWTPNELRTVLGEPDALVVAHNFGVTARGNFEGKNILHEVCTEQQVADRLDITVEEVRAALERSRATLYRARARRVWPARDEKVLTAWNGLMLRALAEAGRILDREEYRAAARANADFLLDQMGAADGRLRRSWRDGQARLDAYLEDYAALVNGLLTTYEATGVVRYFTAARQYADVMLARFWDDETNSFFDTAADHEALIGRPRSLTDNATPSGTSLAVEALLRLGAFTGEARYSDHAVRILVPLAAQMADQPLAFGHLLCALDDFVGPLTEVALIGAANDPATLALHQALASHYTPRMVLATAPPDDATAQATVPLLANRALLHERPTAYVCYQFVCLQPVTDATALLALLA